MVSLKIEERVLKWNGLKHQRSSYSTPYVCLFRPMFSCRICILVCLFKCYTYTSSRFIAVMKQSSSWIRMSCTTKDSYRFNHSQASMWFVYMQIIFACRKYSNFCFMVITLSKFWKSVVIQCSKTTKALNDTKWNWFFISCELCGLMLLKHYQFKPRKPRVIIYKP